MSKVFVNIGLSLDGYMAPEGMTMDKPEYKNWGAKWGAMMAWILNQQGGGATALASVLLLLLSLRLKPAA